MKNITLIIDRTVDPSLPEFAQARGNVTERIENGEVNGYLILTSRGSLATNCMYTNYEYACRMKATLKGRLITNRKFFERRYKTTTKIQETQK